MLVLAIFPDLFIFISCMVYQYKFYLLFSSEQNVISIFSCSYRFWNLQLIGDFWREGKKCLGSRFGLLGVIASETAISRLYQGGERMMMKSVFWWDGTGIPGVGSRI